MVTSIENILDEQNVKLADTVYAQFPEAVRQYQMVANGEYSIFTDEKKLLNYASYMEYHRIYESQKDDVYEELEQRIREIDTENKDLNAASKEQYKQGIVDTAVQEKQLQLRSSKKLLLEKKKALEAAYHKKAEELCKERGILLGNRILMYKKELMLNCYENLIRLFPFLPKKSQMEFFHEMPFYTNDLTELSEALKRGEEIAVEGGPCLFGLQEVYVVIKLTDGTEHKFDYNIAHYGAEDTGEAGCELLEELVSAQSGSIVDISFIDRKKALTRQEYLELKYPFEIAKHFGAKLVIPLPDLSYIKYMSALVEQMEESVAAKGIERFQEVCYRISDMMLETIEEIAQSYQDVSYVVVHDRNRELCEKYYHERAAYFDSSRAKDTIRYLTKNPYRQQSILDYVTMPALPLYLYGIKHVIQVDGMNEVDSYRKCGKIHKSSLALHAMLYPEYVSRDGKHTVFYSKLEDKDYRIPCTC